MVSGELGAARTKIGDAVSFGVGLEVLIPPFTTITQGKLHISQLPLSKN